LIAAVVLAAGGSSRLGEPKQLLRAGGTSLLRSAVEAAVMGGCSPIFVVLGARADESRAELDGLPIEVVRNERWTDGMASSIHAGVAAVESSAASAGGVLLLVCDQPALTQEVVRRVCDAFDGEPGRRVACEYAGTVGVPALFERSLFPRLLELTGDSGAKELLLQEPDRVVRVPWPEGAEDVDTPEDRSRLG
jgi:molybdenum cofactor cytidylyltransferase